MKLSALISLINLDNIGMLQNLNLKIILWAIIAIIFLPLLISPFLFSPPEFGRGIVFRIIIELVFLIWLTVILTNKDYQPKITPILKVLFVYIFITGLSVIFGIHPFFSVWSEPGRLGGYFSLIHYFLLFIIASSVLNKKADWEKIWLAAGITSFLIGFFVIEQRFNFFPNFLNFFLRPPGPLGNSLILSAYSLLLFFPFLGIAVNSQNRFKKIFFGSAAFFGILSIIFAQSRSAYLGLIIGLAVFLYFYPAKNLKIKKRLAFLSLFLLVIFTLGILFIPKITKNTEIIRIFTFIPSSKNIYSQSLTPRLMVWRAGLKAFLDRPILGWGPENFSVAFDKYFDPKLAGFGYAETYFDRAHNILIDNLVASGIFGLISYLAIFGIIFWQIFTRLNFKKNFGGQTISDNKTHLLAAGAGVLAYFIQNIFSFDSVSTYIIFFLLLAWIEYLLNLENKNREIQPINQNSKILNTRLTDGQAKYEIQNANLAIKSLIMLAAASISVYSVFKYNASPLLKNWEMNRTLNFLKNGSYKLALENFERLTNQKTVFDHFYHALEEGGTLYDLAMYSKDSNKEQAKNFLEKAEKRVLDYNHLRPYYVRNYIFLGAINNALSELGVSEAREKAETALKKALEISPKRHQTLLELTNTYLIAGDYGKSLETAQKVIDFNPEIGEAYFMKSLVFIKSENIKEAKTNLEASKIKNFDYLSFPYIRRLAEVLLAANNNDFLEKIYLELSGRNPENPQAHRLLAALYRDTKQFEKAKKEAGIILQLEPKASKQIEEFLKSLPTE